MSRFTEVFASPLAASVFLVSAVGGCSHQERCSFMGDITPHPLGTISDPIWQTQESNAEASDFIIHEHEWVGNSALLNEAGKEHVNQIAVRASIHRYPILIEPSSKTAREDTQYYFPVHNDQELDGRRRVLIVEALQLLGVTDAEDRVIVGPAYAPGFYGFQAQRTFSRGFQGAGGGGGGGGGGAGGGGFGGSF